jgi:hypothetical protein
MKMNQYICISVSGESATQTQLEVEDSKLSEQNITWFQGKILNSMEGGCTSSHKKEIKCLSL